VCLNEKAISDDCSKSAQRCHKAELSQLFPKIEVEFHAAKMFLTMKGGQIVFDWDFDAAKCEQDSHGYDRPHHNSLP
jgi:hypothetical protein